MPSLSYCLFFAISISGHSSTLEVHRPFMVKQVCKQTIGCGILVFLWVLCKHVHANAWDAECDLSMWQAQLISQNGQVKRTMRPNESASQVGQPHPPLVFTIIMIISYLYIKVSQQYNVKYNLYLYFSNQFYKPVTIIACTCMCWWLGSKQYCFDIMHV